MEILWIVLVIAIVCCAFSLSKIGFQLEGVREALSKLRKQDTK